MKDNLKNMNKDINWLEQQLKIKGYDKDEVLLATLDINEKLTIYERNLDKQVKNVLE